MDAYLLTWNPDRFDSWEDLSWILKNPQSRWSCGSRNTLPRGSRVFLLRQGSDPRGIVASGYTTRGVHPDDHWDPERRRKGVKANYVQVKFDVVLGPDPEAVLPVTRLRSGKLKTVHWRTQMSGIQIPPPAVAELERAWKNVARAERLYATARQIQAVENTLTEERTYVRSRDRGLRQRAIVDAEGICEACDFSFGSFLDGLGQRALQVHHRRQLSATDRPRITGLRDLAVVCANCHAMIHADPKRAMPVRTLRAKLRRYSRR
ncbi:MAG: HNH endonuclease [Betaproteobacteria bacterium]